MGISSTIGKRGWITLLTLLWITIAIGQDNQVYTDIQLAKQKPDSVINLDLSNQGLKLFPLEILEFPNLQYLDLSGNSIRDLPKEIDRMSHLNYLDVTGNNITSIPKTISNLVELETLKIGELPNLNIAEAASILPDVKGLQYLDMHGDQLQGVPESFRRMNQLKILDLSGNPIETIPEFFLELSSLEVLYLNDDRNLNLEQSAEIFRRMKLKELHLENDGFSQFPWESLGKSQIEKLYLNRNNISMFPSNLDAQFPALRYLDMSGNPLEPALRDLQPPKLKINWDF